jgi:hypothetical protein
MACSSLTTREKLQKDIHLSYEYWDLLGKKHEGKQTLTIPSPF